MRSCSACTPMRRRRPTSCSSDSRCRPGSSARGAHIGCRGGEQRRLSLATALVRRPDLLILDEPTFGQDHAGYDGLLEILRERLEAGTCLIAATHDERFVADLAERIIRFEAGRIVADEVVV